MATVTEPKELRVLPADIYDTLEFSALVFGGIGARRYFELGGEVPCCFVGHLAFAADSSPIDVENGRNAPKAPIVSTDNDNAVARINQRLHRDMNTRVSWEEYTRELNIVRGE